jgi:hypothetical protein
MRVSRITNNGDWTFGKGRANYISASKAIAQNVRTRIRSFTRDWYLDIEHGIDWINLLGRPGTERRIIRAIERQILQTGGVLTVGDINIVRRDRNRKVHIEAEYTDVFNVPQQISETV